MKNLYKIFFALFLAFPMYLSAQVQVTYNLAYNLSTETYTMSMNSNTAFNPPLSRLTASTQVTIVVPHVAGQWQVTNLSNLTALGWSHTYLDGTTMGLTNDYLFFAPTNAGTYSPFPIVANTSIPLFSFKSGSGCLGNLSLYDNVNDPLNGQPTINADNNMVILGAGAGNKYVGNTSGNVACALPTEVTYNLAYDLNTQAYTMSMNSNNPFNPPLSRLTASTQVTIVVPHVAGQWQVTNLSNLTALGWSHTYLDGTTMGLTNDYLFFAPTNAGTYSPFPIVANTSIPLFSFKSGSGCVGDLFLYDNVNDPLNGQPTINADNNMVILGAGAGNKYVANTSGNISCVPPCNANAGTLGY
jgi:hypothetical protein